MDSIGFCRIAGFIDIVIYMFKLKLSEKFSIGVILLVALPYFISIVIISFVYNDALFRFRQMNEVIFPGQSKIDDIQQGALQVYTLLADAQLLSISQKNSETLKNLKIQIDGEKERLMSSLTNYRKAYAFFGDSNRGLITSEIRALIPQEEILFNNFYQSVSLYVERIGETIDVEDRRLLNQVLERGNRLSSFLSEVERLEFNNFVRQTSRSYGLLFALWLATIGGAISLAVYFKRRIAKPIEKLSDTVVDIAAGKISFIPDYGQYGEVGRLYQAVKNMHDKLRAYIHKLEENNKLESEFISIAAHQLRTPLSSIKWLIEMLLENKNLTAEHREKLQGIYQSNDRLIVLVNDLLNVAKIEGNELVSRRQPSDLRHLIDSILKMIQPEANSRGVKINFTISAPLKEIMIDQILFTEAMKNIIENAVFYSPINSAVDISLSESRGNYIVSVHNEGPAIPEMEHDKLFTKFYRGPMAQRMRPTGSGLGLFIAKLATDAMKGSIWFESPTNKETQSGVTFYLSVPLIND